MATSLQPGILALGVRAHHYLAFDLNDSVSSEQLLEIAGGGLGGVRTTTGGANVVIGFRKEVWERIGQTPPDLADFTDLVGPDGFTMPAGQHDVWVWIAAAGTDVAFDTARAVAASFAPIATLVEDRPAFTYRDGRDLSGFVDGTENPPLNEAAGEITVPEGTPGAGGTIVFVQRWVHDLEKFHAFDVDEQERIIGRTKLTDEELPDDVKPHNAHIARVVIEDEDGEELEVFRRSTPYGDASEHGLMFVAFTRDRARIDAMLHRMVGLDGPRDRLTEWSTPVSAGYYYVPPAEAFPSPEED